MNLWVILWYPKKKKKGIRYPLVGNLLYQVTFFSHLTVSSSHCTIPISHITILFSYLVVPLLFFSHLTVPSSHCTVSTSHVTILFSHLVVPLLFFLTFDGLGSSLAFFLILDGFILTLCSSNITCDSLLSHWVIPFLFSCTWRFHPHIMQF